MDVCRVSLEFAGKCCSQCGKVAGGYTLLLKAQPEGQHLVCCTRLVTERITLCKSRSFVGTFNIIATVALCASV